MAIKRSIAKRHNREKFLTHPKSKWTNGLDECTKLLTMADDLSIVAYCLGRHGIYVRHIQPISENEFGGAVHRPAIVTVQYNNMRQLREAIEDERETIYPKRIFKSAPIGRTEKVPKAFIYTCAYRLCTLPDAKGKTVRVICKHSPELQRAFYKALVDVNGNLKEPLKFDFDEYDLKFWINLYRDSKMKYWCVVGVNGLP